MRVLDSTPEVEAVTGNLFPVGMAHLAAQDLPDLRDILARSFRGALDDYLESGLYHARLPALRKWWIAGRRPRALLRAAKGKRSEDTLVYKEPFLAFAPELPFEALPDARIVYIQRDGRDVADSLVRSYDVLNDERLRGLDDNEVVLGRIGNGGVVPWWVADGEEEAFQESSAYVRAIWMWREMVGRCQAFLGRPEVCESGRILSIRYESLVTDPIGQGRALFDHLGIRLNRSARRCLEEAHADSVGIHLLRERPEIRAAEDMAGEQLERFGYVPVGST